MNSVIPILCAAVLFQATSAAAEGARQRITIEGLDGASGGDLNGEQAVATLEIRAIDSEATPRAPRNRSATLYLTREPGGTRYLLSGLEH